MERLGSFWREEYFLYESKNDGLKFLCYFADIENFVEYNLDGSLDVQELDPNLSNEPTSVECARCGFESVACNVSEDWELVRGYDFSEEEEEMAISEFIEERLSLYLPSVFSHTDLVICSNCIVVLESRLRQLIDSDLRTEIVSSEI